MAGLLKTYVYLIWASDSRTPHQPATLLAGENATPYQKHSEVKRVVDSLNETSLQLGASIEYSYTRHEVKR